MLRRTMHALWQILQPYGFYSTEIGQFGKKPALQILRLSTKSCDPPVSKKISELSDNDLKNVISNEWLDHINILRTFRFLDGECSKMIAKHPDILLIPLKTFENTVKQWSRSTLEMENVQAILFTNPVLLDVEHYIIRKRLSHLFAICGSSGVVTDLLLKSPCVMLDDWNVVLEKINYLVKVKGFHMNSVADSGSISRSLDFIKFRFDLLEKCGIYKQKTPYVHKINKFDQSQHQNPSLKDILCLDDEYFSHAIAKISLEEYNVCYDLFMAEDSNSDED